MKLIVEIDIEGNINFKKDTPKEKIITNLDSIICGKLNDLVLNETLDNSEYIPVYKGKRWIDYIGNIKAIDIK